MNYLITGGTGFIGTHLVKSLTGDGHQVTILSRSEKESKDRLISYRQWDGKKMPLGIGLYDGVINLAGAGIADKGWSDDRKKVILESRVNATRACVDYINKSNRKPKVFLSASAVGIYGGDRREKTPEDARAGDDFLAEVCKKWEETALQANCRTVLPRIGIVLGKGGGALEQMKTPYKMWLGGRYGDGKQGFSWIHINDIVGAMRFALENEAVEGPLNLASPGLVNQAEFSEKLAFSLNVMDLMVVPKFALKMIFGERSILFWGGQNAVPEKLQELGYAFSFPELKPALEDLV
jgi:uncharacterized protein (TIGR01777 family)